MTGDGCFYDRKYFRVDIFPKVIGCSYSCRATPRLQRKCVARHVARPVAPHVFVLNKVWNLVILPKKWSESVFFHMENVDKALFLIAGLFWSRKLGIFLDFSSKNHKKQQKTTKSEKVEKIEFSQTYMIMVPKCSLWS